MKIVHIIDLLHAGGAQTLLITYAQQAKQAGVETYIISLRERNAASTPVVTILENLGVKITFLKKTKLLSPTRLIKLISLIHANKYDIIHTHLNHATVLGILSALWLNKAIVTSVHNVLTGSRRKRLSEKFEQFLLRFADCIIAVGENVNADYYTLFPEKVVTLTNAVNEIPPMDAKQRASIRHELTGNVEAPLLIAVGRLNEQKGFDTLIKAFEIVHTQFPQAHLVVAGRGNLEETLRLESNTRGLQKNLHWLGLRDDVPSLLAASDIYVSSAYWEGLSIALLEAMSVGLPCVITAVGDAEKVITPETGMLVPPRSAERLAEEVIVLLSDTKKSERIGKAAQERVRDHYGAKTWFNKLIEIYQHTEFKHTHKEKRIH